jgi:hypothetical protein
MADGVKVRLIRIDGTAVSADWEGTPDGRTIEVRTADGREQVPLDELSSVLFPAAVTDRNPLPTDPVDAAPAKRWPGIVDPADDRTRDDEPALTPVIVYLPGGERLYGSFGAPPTDGDAVLVHTAWGGDQLLPFDRLAALQFARPERFAKAGELFRAALRERRPGEDVLITRGVDEANVARGRVESLNASGGSFFYGERSRNFRNQKLFGIVFAAGALLKTASPVSVRLAEGSVIPGSMVRADADHLLLEASWGATLTLPITELAELLCHSDRVVYLSDLTPRARRIEGRLHRDWPVGADHNVNGGLLSLSGRTFRKGLGVHSRTELTYSLDGGFERFAAIVGIDDAVRPRGSVVFRVSGDGKTLFDSGTMSGADAPRDVVADVGGVKELVLLVDFADELDIADVADWADARLIKPAGKASPQPPGRGKG